ncbi:hypothetical protein VUR80DRAFT_2950 [Thermomyces stellatus]
MGRLAPAALPPTAAKHNGDSNPHPTRPLTRQFPSPGKKYSLSCMDVAVDSHKQARAKTSHETAGPVPAVRGKRTGLTGHNPCCFAALWTSLCSSTRLVLSHDKFPRPLFVESLTAIALNRWLHVTSAASSGRVPLHRAICSWSQPMPHPMSPAPTITPNLDACRLEC